jgi:ribosome recycling factor
MTPNQIVENVKKEFDKALGHFQDECKKLRTGRAHPSMVEGLSVVAYGVPTPLVQLATITTPESMQIQISPFDSSNVQKIAEAIRNAQELGFNPTDDGRVVRINIPALTTERRQQIVKQLGERKEDCYVSMRQARHDGMDSLKKLKSDKAISEDDQSRAEKQIDEQMTKSKVEVASRSTNQNTSFPYYLILQELIDTFQRQS